MTDVIEYVLLDRYICGTSAEAERVRAEQWIASDAWHSEVVDWMRSLHSAATQLSPSWDGDELWRGLELRIAAAEPGRQQSHLKFQGMAGQRRRSWRLHLLRVAAVLGLVAGSVALWHWGGLGRAAPPPHGARTYATRRGERAVFRLPDGSRVTLAAGSRLEAPDAFDGRSRDVSLSGRAYFEVSRNPTKPFRVHAGRATTEVLGTRFDVRAYPEEATVAVAVADGSVAVAVGTGRLLLQRGDLARLDTSGHAHLEHGIEVDRYLAWTEGRVQFVNTPLRDVLPELMRWYDVDIRLGDSALGARPLTASFGTESATEMLRLLEIALQVHAEQAGRVVTLHSSQLH